MFTIRHNNYSTNHALAHLSWVLYICLSIHLHKHYRNLNSHESFTRQSFKYRQTKIRIFRSLIYFIFSPCGTAVKCTCVHIYSSDFVSTVDYFQKLSQRLLQLQILRIWYEYRHNVGLSFSRRVKKMTGKRRDR